MSGRLHGVNGWGSYRATPAARVTAGFVRMWKRLELDADSASPGSIAAAGNDPTHWFHIGASFDLRAQQEFDIRVRRVGSLPNPHVPAYTAVDARYSWKVSREIELSLSVQNLLDRSHPEWGAPGNRAGIERAYFIKVLWRR